MIAALVTGVLFRSTESRTAKSGKPFVAASTRIKDGDGSQFVRIVAFSESAQNELLRLHDGDCLSVQGQLTASIYTSADGNAKVSLSIIANNVLALRQLPKERKAPSPEPAGSRQQRLAGSWQSPTDGPDDDIDFGGSP